MGTGKLLIFSLDECRYAVALSAVVRVVAMVDITPLPKAPEIVAGAIVVAGEIVPVIDMRKRFRLPPKDVALDDCLIIARTDRHQVALIADRVTGITELQAAHAVAPSSIFPNLKYLAGAMTLDGGLVFIHDLDTFLTRGEEEAMEQAVRDLAR